MKKTAPDPSAGDILRKADGEKFVFLYMSPHSSLYYIVRSLRTKEELEMLWFQFRPLSPLEQLAHAAVDLG